MFKALEVPDDDDIDISKSSTRRQADNEEPGEKEEEDDDSSAWQTVAKVAPSSKKDPRVVVAATTRREQSAPAVVSTPPACQFNQQHIDLVCDYVRRSVPLMVVLRGVSGSGKSTLAKLIRFNGEVLSADDYFTNASGVYNYVPTQLNDAHVYSKTKAKEALKAGVSPVIIDNTNLKIWELKPYVKMALAFNYQVEVLEPLTPWRAKAPTLSEKNVHGVPLARIKKNLDEFERLDLAALLNELRSEQQQQQQQQRHVNTSLKAKQGSFLSNYKDFLKNDWSLPELESTSPPSSSNTSSKETSPTPTFNGNTNDTAATNDPKSFLKQLFPGIDEQIINDLLVETNNNISMVSEFLTSTARQEVKKPSSSSSSPPPVVALRSPPSLETLCIEALNKLEKLFETHNNSTTTLTTITTITTTTHKEKEKTPTPSSSKGGHRNRQLSKSGSDGTSSHAKMTNQQSAQLFEFNTKFSNNNPQQQQQAKTPTSTSTSNQTHNKRGGPLLQEERRHDDDDDDEDIALDFKVNREFMRSLISLFGDNADEEALDSTSGDAFEIPIPFKLAQKLYSSWKKTTATGKTSHNKPIDFPKSPPPSIDCSINDTMQDDEQILSDEQLSAQLFNEINIRDPIENVPVYLRSPAVSLMQIMAEQTAEESKRKQQQRITSGRTNNKSGGRKKATSPEMNSSSNNNNNETTMAIMVNKQHLYERYGHLIDKNMLDQIFKDKNYNFKETCNYIDTFYELSENSAVKEINTKISLNSSLADGNDSAAASPMSPNVYAAASQYNRSLAKKHCHLRQLYFEKASEAYNRGWGAVAQYYAELGHSQNTTVKEYNNMASQQIFLANNPDIRNSNTLDLHGLHLKEALNVLKQMIAEKCHQLNSPNKSKKRPTKSILFVITGHGRHSVSEPTLRPNVISYLSSHDIKYKEPHAGLLSVDLLSAAAKLKK